MLRIAWSCTSLAGNISGNVNQLRVKLCWTSAFSFHRKSSRKQLANSFSYKIYVFQFISKWLVWFLKRKNKVVLYTIYNECKTEKNRTANYISHEKLHFFSWKLWCLCVGLFLQTWNKLNLIATASILMHKNNTIFMLSALFILEPEATMPLLFQLHTTLPVRSLDAFNCESDY